MSSGLRVRNRACTIGCTMNLTGFSDPCIVFLVYNRCYNRSSLVSVHQEPNSDIVHESLGCLCLPSCKCGMCLPADGSERIDCLICDWSAAACHAIVARHVQYTQVLRGSLTQLVHIPATVDVTNSISETRTVLFTFEQDALARDDCPIRGSIQALLSWTQKSL